MAKEAHSGQNSTVSFASLDHDGLWLKTCQGYSQVTMDGSLETFSGTWPKAGMMQNGICYRQPRLVLYTEGKGYSYWPTPRVAVLVGKAKATDTHGWDLPAAVKDSLEKKPTRMWPTPTVPRGGVQIPKDAKWVGRTSAYKAGKKYQVSLHAAVKVWPTPTSRDWKSGNASQETLNRNSRPLNEIVKVYPTPQATDWKQDGHPHGKEQMGLPEVIGGQLNPTWVEWLMGFPSGWTDLDALETP